MENTMTRNLKILGLALMAALALSAVVASSASAQKLTSDGSVTLKADETGVETDNALTSESGNKVTCPGSSYTGHKYNVTPHALIPSGEKTLTVTPHYNQANHNCQVTAAFGIRYPATVHMSGCDYVMHLGATTGGVAHTYGVTTDIVCSSGKEITITIYTNNADHDKEIPFCVQHIPPQVNRPGLHATDTTNGHVDLKGTITGLTVNQTTSPTGHHFLCPARHETNATFHLDVTGTGFNSLGGKTNISLSHP
jgi:hypothetical protein